MKKFVIAPFLAALAMFVWGFVYWGTSPLPYQTLGSVSDDSAVAESLGKLFPATGAYLLPSPAVGEAKAAELMKRGPIAQVFIVKKGKPPMDPAAMGKGFIHMLVMAIVLTGLLVGAEKAFETWRCRVLFSAMIGAMVGLCDLGAAIWWHHPWGWTLMEAIYDLTMFTVAGLVLAKFVTPKPGA